MPVRPTPAMGFIENRKPMKAVVLLSGGMDSATVLAYAKNEGYDVLAVSFNYGQRHEIELAAGSALAYQAGVKRLVIPLKLGAIWKSALIGPENGKLSIPNYQDTHIHEGDIPATYVPDRNIIFLSIACAIAESIDAEVVFGGMNALDYSGYPDCRPEFIQAFNKMLRRGSKAGIEGKLRVEAPLIDMTKKEIVELALKLGVPLELTWSCYRGGQKACGKCDSCALRLKGFREAGAVDPLEYEVRE